MVTNKIDEFWQWFLREENKYYHADINEVQPLLDKAINRVRKIHTGLNVLFSGQIDPVTNKREVIISSNGNIELFPHVFEVIEKAPVMERWVITALKPRLSKDQLNILKLSHYGKMIDLKKVSFRYRYPSITGEKKIDLMVMYDNMQFDSASLFYEITLNLLEFALGEFDFSTKLGQVLPSMSIAKEFGLSIPGIESFSRQRLPLAQLASTVDDKVLFDVH